MRYLALSIAALALAACETTPPAPEDPQDIADAARTVACQGEVDCRAKFDRAAAWVRATSPHVVAVSSPGMLVTNSPAGSDPRPGYMVAQMPDRIELTIFCYATQGCSPTEIQSRARFYRAAMGQ